MGKIDDLLSEVGDDKLRGQLVAAVADLLGSKKFGPVYRRIRDQAGRRRRLAT